MMKKNPTQRDNIVACLALCSLVLLAALTNSGCGKMNDALSATNGMPDQLRATNDQIKATNGKMDATNSAIHKQVLETSLEAMRKPENSQNLLPPTRMIPFAQAFADEATPLEVVQLAHVNFKDINEVQPERLPKDPKERQAFLIAFDHDKQVSLTIVELIAGLLSQQKTEALAQAQIEEHGRFEDAAYKALMVRSLFISNILIGSDLFSPTTALDNVSKMEEAAEGIKIWVG